MKFILFALAITACLAFEPEDDTPIIDFMKGFLEGIGETKNIEDLIKCLKEAEAIFQKIKAAIELIKTKDPVKILEGVKMLIDALKELLEMIRPCAEGYKQLLKLIEKLKKIDIKKIVQKIITHPVQVIKLITEALHAYAAKDYYGFGKAIGQLIKLLVLDAEMDEEDTPATLFMKGFLDGIGETTDPKKLLECVQSFEVIFKEIEEAIKKIMTLNPLEVIKGIGMLIAAVMKIFDMLEPCIKDYPVMLKLWAAMKNADIEQIFQKIMANPMPILMALIAFVQAIQEKEWKSAGKNLGKVLKILFLDP